MPIELPETDLRPGDIAREIDANGYAVIENYIRSEDLASLIDFAQGAVARSEGEYAGFKDQELDETLVGAIQGSPRFKDLCRSVYEAGTGISAPSEDFYRVLRCLRGTSGRTVQHSLNFHYDSYALTVLLPVVIPAGKVSGDLLMIPNVRRLRPSLLNWIQDSLFVYNPVAQAALRLAYRKNYRLFKRLKLVPGNLYMFWAIDLCMQTSRPTRRACEQRPCSIMAGYDDANVEACLQR